MFAKKVGAVAFVVAITYPLHNSVWLPTWGNNILREDRTVIVTGATGKMGSAITYHLAKRKPRIIMACRDMDKCKTIRREIVMWTGHKGIACRHLDLEDIDSINRFADEMIKDEPHIDVLINSAGVVELKEKELTKYGIEKHYFVNFLGPFLLTFRLMDKLKESANITLDSRVINIVGKPKKWWKVDTSDINFEARKYNPKIAYTQSKLALAYFTILLEKFSRDDKSHIYVYGINPMYHRLSPTFDMPIGTLEGFQSLWTAFHSTHAIRPAQPVVKCALDPNLARPDRSGKLFGRFLTGWGWGSAAASETKAKVVWNMAAQALVEAPEKLKISPDNTVNNKPPNADS